MYQLNCAAKLFWIEDARQLLVETESGGFMFPLEVVQPQDPVDSPPATQHHHHHQVHDTNEAVLLRRRRQRRGHTQSSVRAAGITMFSSEPSLPHTTHVIVMIRRRESTTS
ncbi:hypothetical protein PybrP1_002409 [[Pythium] brassicae (nom. inval.)]|nr:hypothetical protein PybrP1_002409 [[Pythium] brassicae (nom. inval.)]